MAELATIARPYADALFQAQTKDLDATAQWLDALAALVHHDALLQYVNSPKATDKQVLDLISSVLSESKSAALPVEGQRFLQVLIENARLSALPEIALQFHALKNKQKGTADATVFSAWPIDAAVLSDVSGVLEKRFARKLNLRVEIDASLIGGVRVVVGDEVLDTSVKARLDQMKVALTA